ncbi:uncharacterized protein LOC125052958 isoform X4 [Pieris napi]|nr:uncharacterized protein LOC125052958 isoform X4 [Pieris napi]
MNEIKADFRKDVAKRLAGVNVNRKLPENGLPSERVVEEIRDHLSLGSYDWKGGHVSGAVYHTNDDIYRVACDAYALTAYTNPLHADVFPGINKMEAEIVRMAINLFHGDDKCCGTVTTGGTESIMMACKAFRDRAYNKGISNPQMVLATTAHTAFDKAAQYLGISVVTVPVNPDTLTVDIDAVKKAIGRRTCLIVGSAPNFPYGTMDDIRALSNIALEYEIPLHVDACLGGFVACFMPDAGYPVPDFDFRLPGVASMSADTHKYGFAPKGTSVVLYRHEEYRHGQYTVTTDWPGGVYGSPTVNGSRAGGSIAACWASMMYIGKNRYVEMTREILQTTNYILEELRKIKGIFIFGKPATTVIAFGSKQFDIFKMADLLHKKGWSLNALQFPSGIHICVTHAHTAEGVAERFVNDTRVVAAECLKAGDAPVEGKRWVEELAREAQLWADQCRPPEQLEEHDLCRDLYSTTVGQCVASIVGEAPGLRPETMVDIWYMQRISYEGNFTSYVPPVRSSQYYGDFAQLVWSRTYMVGCGRSRFMAPWRGRLRSVERLVCNFAPRGPVSFRALWTLGRPASICPPRSRPDTHVPGLCSFQNNLNDSDDKYNKHSAEEHLLLNTVLEVETNDTHDHIGLFDEYYLKKVAISNLSLNPTDMYKDFVHTKDIIEDFELEEQVNEKSTHSFNVELENGVTKKIEEKKKVRMLGRYKSFDLEDLEDQNTSKNLKNVQVEETTKFNELYADLEYLDVEKIYDTVTNDITLKNDTEDLRSNDKDGSFKLETNTSNPLNMTRLNQIILPNTTVFSNQTTKHDDLDDYLADPETFRQLQEALDRMENSLAGPVSTVGKVRRELRTLPPNKTSINRSKQNIMTPEELQAEIERNRTLDRGPMLNMVLKYLPYLKPYEKTIMGEVTSNSVARILPNVLALLLCL